MERSIYGWSNIPTPNFDRVAREDVLFTRGISSAPSRVALLTGRTFWELEQGAFIRAWLPARFPAMTRALHAFLQAVPATPLHP